MKDSNFYSSLFYSVLATLAMIFVVAVPFVMAETGEGQRIAQSVYDRPDGRTVITETSMVLESPGSQPRQRKFYSYRKDFDNGEIHSLVRFTLPADVKDTGLLTRNNVDGENDQWLYLPALTRVRRIAGDRKGGRFVGSDLYYEDLQDRKVHQDHHVLKGQEEINGTLCDIIESTPVDPANSSYSKRILWVHPETMIPIRIDFYQNNQNTPVKRLLVKKIDNVEGYWTVMETEISDLKKDHKTHMRIDHISYDADLSDSLFSQSVLQDPSREMSYRPN